MQETNVSVAKVGPLEIDELGYKTYGGRGYNRVNTPTVEVRRSSIWEDYTPNRCQCHRRMWTEWVQLSPVNADEFLGSDWSTRRGIPLFLELIVWGSGGGDDDDLYDEVNASVIAWTDDTTGNTMTDR